MKNTLRSITLLAVTTFIGLNPTLAQPTPPGGPGLVITEIMYNPPEANNDTLEFLEILNPGLAAVNMTGYYFSSGIEYTFPDGFMLGAAEYVLISGDSVIFETWYGVPAFEWTGGTALSNDGEGLALRSGSNAVVDTVFFDDAAAWPADADGGGYSLVLCDPTSDNNLPENWTASENNFGFSANGLPIYADPNAASTCLTTGIADATATDAFSIYPNPTDGDFNISLAETKEDAMLELFDVSGKVVYTQNLKAGQSRTINVELDLNSGIYVLKAAGNYARLVITK